MTKRVGLNRVCFLLLPLAAAACSSTAQPAAPTAPTPTNTIAAPTPVSPLTGATSAGWPTLTVIDSTHASSDPLVYRFDISNSSAFTTILATGVVSEMPTRTSLMPQGGTPPPAGTVLYWRAIAIDPINVAASPASTAQSFTYQQPPSTAAQIAAQQGVALWSGAQPPGTPGQANLGGGWAVGPRVWYTGVAFESPTLEQLQVFDLLDRGMDPQSALNWMNGNGYSTSAAYYPPLNVIGFQFAYMALDNGFWDLVQRSGA